MATEAEAVTAQKERAVAKKTAAPSIINHPKPPTQPGPTPPVQPTIGTTDTRADKVGKGKVLAVLLGTAGPNHQTPYDGQQQDIVDWAFTDEDALPEGSTLLGSKALVDE